MHHPLSSAPSLRPARILTCALLALCTSFTVMAKDHDHEESTETEHVIAWADVPVVVQQAIEHEAAGAAILEVEAESKHDKLSYEAKVKRADGTVWEITVNAKGKVKKVEADDGDDDEDKSAAADDHDGKKSKKKKKSKKD